MTASDPPIKFDMIIIGTGMAAALLVARQILAEVQTGITGGIRFASGLLDLLGVHPTAERRRWSDPWAGIARRCADETQHPYARLRPKAIRQAMGAAYAAGLAVGFRSGLEELKWNGAIDKTWQPHMLAGARQKGISAWRKAVQRTRDWVE